MNTYKIGNTVTGIIRSYASGSIGDVILDYDNQPYTVVKSVEANLIFKDLNSVSQSKFTELVYNDNKLTQVQLSNVTLGDKILNLIFSKTDSKLVSRLENCVSDEEKQIYLTAPSNILYQVFIYGADGALAVAYGTWDASTPIAVPQAQEDYLVCYQYEGNKGYSLDKPDNHYFTLDLLITGNKEENTTNMTIHIEKSALRIDKNMYFNQRSNTVDLIFTVIDTEANYITLE